MNIKEIIAILLSVFGVLIGFQLGVQGISLWLILPLAFAMGLIVFVLLSDELFTQPKGGN